MISTSISNATLGVEPNDAGVAAATASASQQVGASLGTALVSTIAASAVTHYLAGGHHVRGPVAHAAVVNGELRAALSLARDPRRTRWRRATVGLLDETRTDRAYQRNCKSQDLVGQRRRADPAAQALSRALSLAMADHSDDDSVARGQAGLLEHSNR